MAKYPLVIEHPVEVADLHFIYCSVHTAKSLPRPGKEDAWEKPGL